MEHSCAHARIGWSNPVATAGLGGAILLPQQDWVEQSCCHSRIGWSNPVATAGLGGAILLPQQDWVEQACCRSRIDKGNPVATAGLTAGRVSGEKKHSVSDTARTASLTDLRRWPGDGFFGMKPNSGSDAMGSASLPQDFGQNRKLKRSRKTDLGVERSRNPDLGGRIPTLARAWQAPMPGRFAETVGLDDSFEKKILGRIPTWAWQGSDAGQARPGGRNVAR